MHRLEVAVRLLLRCTEQIDKFHCSAASRMAVQHERLTFSHSSLHVNGSKGPIQNCFKNDTMTVFHVFLHAVLWLLLGHFKLWALGEPSISFAFYPPILFIKSQVFQLLLTFHLYSAPFIVFILRQHYL